MLERDFNSIITKTINEAGGYSFKIPDSFSMTTGYHSKNPYDIFGLYQGKFLALELKWLQKPQAFNFTRLEQHQIDNLIKSYEIMKDNSFCALVIGVDYGRNDKRVFVWSNDELYKIRQRKEEGISILKKEFDTLPYVKISKGKCKIV